MPIPDQVNLNSLYAEIFIFIARLHFNPFNKYDWSCMLSTRETKVNASFCLQKVPILVRETNCCKEGIKCYGKLLFLKKEEA